MATGGICDARCQAFWTTMIRREEAMRIRWFLKNQQKLLARLEKSKQISMSPTREADKPQSVDTIRLKPLPNWRPMEPDGSINMNIMKPIDPEVRAILYENTPSFIAAENYARERLKDSPEDRYYYPDCTSWVHGWRLTDYPPVPRSKVGSRNVLIREFYHPRISSLQNDPEWYRSSQKTLNKCNNTS
ncbi:uncharacterized protein LOC100879851 [Megachile rotundata]|uniref:uncharacterized protein LOC100879851 n=1 Tax=Megachile rotundata TaxID=143995 RepID=UPI003FCF0842